MIKGPDPVQAIDLVVSFGFYDAVFSPPPKDIIISGNLGDPKICLITAKILKWLLSDESKDFNVHSIFHLLGENEKRVLYLAACMLPYKDMVYTGKKKSQPAYQYIIRESIKFSNNDVDKVKIILSSIDFIISTVGQNNEVLIDRVALGLSMRELGSEWPTNLLFALSNELVSVFEDKDQVKEINSKYTKFVKRIYELKLENVYREKHILNGKDIQNLLNIKPGPIIKEVSNSIMEWQLKYPNNSKEECQEFIKHKYGRT
jgi:tRNA nucleotidyltransferase (CCA-adding enzyme)